MNITERVTSFFSPTAIPSWRDITTKVKKSTFTLASYLTDPVCSFDADKMYLKEKVFSQLFPCDGSLESRVANWIRKSVIATNMTTNLILTPFTAPLGILLRSLGTNLSSELFLYETTSVPPKPFPENKAFTLANWNILLIPGENSLLHGGAPQADSYYKPSLKDHPAQGLPYLGLEWLFSLLGLVSKENCLTRLDTIIADIQKSDADVICLYEGFDFGAVEKIKSAVQDKFHCMISNIAPRSIGTNSGVVILSKFHIERDSVLVKPFPKSYPGPNNTMIQLGPSGYSEKSLVRFSIYGKDLEGEQKAIADIYPEHLFHSESPDPKKVTSQEKTIRAWQLSRVLEDMKTERSDTRSVILCGDLNLDPDELKAHPLISSPEGLSLKGEPDRMITWGGDAASAAIEGIEPSGPQQLDYVLAKSDTVRFLETEAYNLGNFDPNVIKWDYRSDHYLLKTRIGLN